MSSKGPLIVRLCNWVGEAILSLPTLIMLADQGYELHLIGKSWALTLFDGHGWPIHVRPGKRSLAVDQLKNLKKQLASESQTFARQPHMLLFTNSFSSALEARLAGLKPIGYARDGRRLLLTKAVPQAATTHAADNYWRIGAHYAGLPLGRPPTLGLRPSETQKALAQQIVEQHQLQPSFVILCPFSGAADATGKKLWLDFPKLAQALNREGRQVVLCPGPDEEHLAHTDFPTAKVISNVDLGTYAALSMLAACTISNDTGPGHLAAAAGSRVISVFGPGSTQHWTPIGPAVTVLHPDHGWPSVQEVLNLVRQSPAT